MTSYLLAVTALLLLAGALADRFGRRRILRIGLLVMLVGSILCAAAPSTVILVAARVVQGVGAALVVPNSLALLNGTLRPSDRARGIRAWAGLSTLATLLGPYVGGWLVDRQSWRAVFVFNVPLILGALAVLQAVPESTDEHRPFSLDVSGALLAVIGLGGVIYALTAGPASGWGSPKVLRAGAAGALALIALVPAERRVRVPMLRLSLFTSRQFDAINATTFLLYGALGTAGYLLILQCELQLGYSATKAGAALIPSSAIFLFLSPLSGALVERVGPRRLIVTGILAVTGSLLWLSTLETGANYAEAILPATLLWGFGIGLTVTPLTAAVLAAVSDPDLGEASAVNNAVARLGGLITIAVVPALLGANGGRTLEQSLAHGYRPAMIAMAGLSAAAALVAVVFVTNDRINAPRLLPAPPDHGCATAQGLPERPRRHPRPYRDRPAELLSR